MAAMPSAQDPGVTEGPQNAIQDFCGMNTERCVVGPPSSRPLSLYSLINVFSLTYIPH